MVCGSCVVKLASRLAEHYRLDWIDALTRAYKGMERVEKRLNPHSNPKIRSGNPSDYEADCEGYCGRFTCAGVYSCVSELDCFGNALLANCDADQAHCPYTPPKPNSHWVSDTCYCPTYTDLVCWGCLIWRCAGVMGWFDECPPMGTCYYDCDDGYQWNPVTEQCELIPPPPPPAKPLINKPLVNQLLINMPIVRLLS